MSKNPDIYTPLAQTDPPKGREGYKWYHAQPNLVYVDDNDDYRPFWAVTKHADIMEIERQSNLFISEPRLFLITKEEEQNVRDMTGGSDLLLRTMAHMAGD